MPDVRRFLRDNIVLVAAAVLPAAVALLFVLATVIPRWTIPLPMHDLVLRAEASWESPPEMAVDFTVRDGRLEATLRGLPQPEARAQAAFPYTRRWKLLLFDHESMQVREISTPDLPSALRPDETRTVVVEALADRRVFPGTTAPDGYEVRTMSSGGAGGLVGELFGMRGRYQRGVTLSRAGRTIQLALPAPYRESYGAIYPMGWLDDGDRR